MRVVDYGESAQVFRVPVRDLLDPDNRVMATVTRAGQTFQSPAFTVNEVVVWGFTGMILNQLFDQLGWAVPWDRTSLLERRYLEQARRLRLRVPALAGRQPRLLAAGGRTARVVARTPDLLLALGLVHDQPGGGVLPHGVDARGRALDAC